MSLRRLSTLTFARRYIKLDGREFNPADRPWVVEPLEFMDRVRGGIFLLKASIQSFKSGAAQLFAARQLALEPGRMLWYSKTGEAINQFADEKWNPLLDNCPPVQRILFDNPHKRTRLSLSLPFGHFQMLSSGPIMSRNSKSARDITCDEPWEYEPGHLTEIQGRYSDFEQCFRLILPTSGPDAGSEVDEIWKDSDQRTWHVCCPSCGKPFHYIFKSMHEPDRRGGLRFDRSEAVFLPDGRINSAALAATVRYECPHCTADLTYSPSLQSTLNRPANGARHIPLNLSPKPKVHAWTWNALCHMDWNNLAEMRLRAEIALSRGDETKIEDFIRKREARAYDIREFVHATTADAAKGDYALYPYEPSGVLVPGTPAPVAPYPDCLFRTLKIDVQQDHYWWSVRAWWRDCTSKLVAYGKAVSQSELRDIQHFYGVKDHGGEIVLDPETDQYTMPRGCGVYLDGNYNPSQVRRLAAAYHWCVLRGEDCKDFRHRDGFYRVYDEIRVIDAFEGTIHSSDRYVPEIRFSNNGARNRLALMRSIEEPRRLWTYAKDVSETYTNHLNAWVRVEKRQPKSNALYYEWRQVADRDDLFWCEKVDMVIASMAGLIGASEPAPQTAAESKSESTT